MLVLVKSKTAEYEGTHFSLCSVKTMKELSALFEDRHTEILEYWISGEVIEEILQERYEGFAELAPR